MIDFQPITLQDKDRFNAFLYDGQAQGCEYSFVNLYLWGRQRACVLQEHLVLFSQFNRKSVYPFPVGTGDKKAVLDAIIADAHRRGIPCRITSLNEDSMALLEQLYPGKFRFHCDRNSYDYVYSIDDLADLKGRKYQRKRNHVNRFNQSYPYCEIQPLSDSNRAQALEMAKRWYEERLQQDPSGDYHMERSALLKALEQSEMLGMEALVMFDGDTVIAFTMGSRLSPDTFDVHFEKARADVDGAYAAINSAFARYIREKYPEVRYLNREDDLGLEGLRKAKLSYCPHHMVEKCWACLLEEGYDY